VTDDDDALSERYTERAEAARVFVEHIRGMVAQPTQSDALREALERIGVGMMPPEIIEGKLTLRLVRVDIAQEQSK
jgi:hypothetical protein